MAQTPVFKIEDNTGTALLLVNDDGSITMPTGATNGYVLTTDAQGNATWMPAGGGGSLTLPFAGTTASSSPAFSVENTGTGRGLESTAQGVALWASSSSSEGLRVSSAGTRGVFVVSSSQEAFGAQFVGGDGVSIFRAGNPSATTNSAVSNGFEIGGAEGNGLFVGHADQNGVLVESATTAGVHVESAVGDGVRVISAGNPTTMSNTTLPLSNGFEVEGAEGFGLFVGHTDQSGVMVNSAHFDGLFVKQANGQGVHVLSANAGGVVVSEVGNPFGTGSPSGLPSGFEVSRAEGYGLYVGHADEDGVHVESAGSRAGYFNGDVEITGNLNGVKMPIAYGTINSQGNIVTASPNVTNVTRSGAGIYFITVQGETASLNHIVMVTPITTGIGQFNGSAYFSTLFPPEFNVITLDGSGSSVNSAFSFVIYKP